MTEDEPVRPARPGAEWLSAGQVARYRETHVPHRDEGETVLRELLPERVGRVLDLGCGDGRLLALVREARPGCRGVALDFSPVMLEMARERFAGEPLVEVVAHDLGRPLPDLGRFDLVVSSFVIHHLEDARKRSLYAEVLDLLPPGGALLNLEHVASATPALHARFLATIGLEGEADADPSDRLAPVEAQLAWMREAGFAEVDCHWKWLELALLAGVAPEGA